MKLALRNKVSERREQDTAWVCPAPHNNPSQVRPCKHQFELKHSYRFLKFIFLVDFDTVITGFLLTFTFTLTFHLWLVIFTFTFVNCNWVFFTFTFLVGSEPFAVHSHLHFCSWITSRHFLNKRQPKLQARDSGIWWVWRFNVNYRFRWNTSRKLEIARFKLILHFWWGTLGKMQLMLRKAAKALYAVRRIYIFTS